MESFSTEYKGVSCVYRILCDVNGMEYIGQTNDVYRRSNEHKNGLKKGTHRNKKMQEDYNKFGHDAFCMEILYTGENLDEREKYYIKDANDRGLCYNVFGGGKRSFEVNDEFRAKISAAHKGRVVSEETRRKNAEAAKRQWQNKQYREKMTESAKRQWLDDGYRKMMHDLHTGNTDACGHKLTKDCVLSARKEYHDGVSIAELSVKYGVTECTIRSAISGRSWKNI